MCGIVGMIRTRSHSVEMGGDLSLLKHRGPDSEGSWQDETVWLGHTRLAIQDLSPNGRQPMQSADGRYVLVFNGEIYNHWDIRKTLEGEYAFRSTSDAETLLYALIEKGKNLLPLLNGIYAFAFYDCENRSLMVARDPMGVKPLYYYGTDEVFAWSSEMKAILPWVEQKDISVQALHNYLTFLWSPGEATPLRNVKKLLPGHCLYIEIEGETLNIIDTEFYRFPFTGEYLSMTDEAVLIDKVDRALRRAVERQLLSDVPVGFFLSGGLDSSLLVAIAKKMHPEQKYDCFTINTGEAEYTTDGFASDLHYARLVAKYLDVHLHVVEAQANVTEEFDRMVWHLDEPQADPAPLNVLNICRGARDKGIKVLIGGAAGDDLFSGYRRHQAVRVEKYLDKMPLWLKNIARWLCQNLPAHSTTGRRLKKLTADWDKSPAERLANYFAWLPEDRVKGLFTAKYRNLLQDYSPLVYLHHLDTLIPQEKNWLNKMLHWELKSFLVDHNLNYTDKLAMAVGIEVRVPFLDLDLVELACQLPPEIKMKGRETKYILKKVAERYLPHEIIYRPKTGFGAPIREWIKKDLSPLIEQRLSQEAIERWGIFDANAVQQLIADNQNGKIDAAYSVWTLLAIQSWLEQFANKNS